MSSLPRSEMFVFQRGEIGAWDGEEEDEEEEEEER